MTEKVELIVGPRFQFTRADMEQTKNPLKFPGLRTGAGPSVVIDRMPISGPIVRERDDDADPEGGTMWRARCLLCRDPSRLYKKKNERALFGWAVKHRCKPKLVEYIGYGPAWVEIKRNEK
jgi:hypothetical protein